MKLFLALPFTRHQSSVSHNTSSEVATYPKYGCIRFGNSPSSSQRRKGLRAEACECAECTESFPGSKKHMYYQGFHNTHSMGVLGTRFSMGGCIGRASVQRGRIRQLPSSATSAAEVRMSIPSSMLKLHLNVSFTLSCVRNRLDEPWVRQRARPRRNRKSEFVRSMVRENIVTPR